jgi:DNA-binding NarL/FixJ family response regulator
MTRILIADDSPHVRKGIRNLLQRHSDWQVCAEAVDGKDAIHKSDQLHPDVVILDFSMPVLNGIEAAQSISRICPTASILLCSMFMDSQLVSMARKAGISCALSKSNVGQIVSGIEAVLDGNEFVASRL